MNQAALKLVAKPDSDKQRALEAALAQIDRAFGKGSVMKLGDKGKVVEIESVPTGSLGLDMALGIGGLPKGRIDAGETVLDAANRELKEEAGFGARSLRILRSITLAPTYMTHAIDLVLAEDLYPERLVGDEPEVLEVVPWRLDRLHELVLREDCSEGRSLAALLIIKELVRTGA